MAKYRKKPVVIEAFQWVRGTGNADWNSLPPWIRLAYETGHLNMLPEGARIYTPEGWMQVNINDWVIQGLEGEWYPCKPSIFEATYELVEEGAE
ncbi:MAG: putative phage protein [Chloroflexi bacterium]|nr:putative phage protein [Chloroflexota bacterium]